MAIAKRTFDVVVGANPPGSPNIVNRAFPKVLLYMGMPFIAVICAIAGWLVWEETVLTWEYGPQTPGFFVMHSDLKLLLVSGILGGVIWLAIVLFVAVRNRSFGGKLGVGLLLFYVLAWGLIAMPYELWQRMFIDKFSPSVAVDVFTYAASTGELATVKTFLERGIDVNVQGRYGTALHGAAVGCQDAIIELLIAHGADVNARDASGGSPLDNAIENKERCTETQTLLLKHGGKLRRNNRGQTLRSPLKVAVRDGHNATVQGLHQARVAGMLPCHVVQAATPA